MENKRSRGRPLSFNRDIALSKAAECFWANGYEGTSISDLTNAMGITPQSLYTAFNSKAELFRQSLDWYAATFGGLEPDHLNGPGIVRTLTEWLHKQARAFASPSHPKGCMISVAAVGFAEENLAIARMASAKRENTIEQLRLRLSRAVSEGELKAETDSASLARFIGAIVQGMTIQARDGANEGQLIGLANVACAALTASLSWTASTSLDKSCPHDEACSKAYRLIPLR